MSFQIVLQPVWLSFFFVSCLLPAFHVRKRKSSGHILHTKLCTCKTSGLELRIWKGKAIYKKGTLDLGGHFGQAKRHQGHPRKGTKAPPQKKGSKSKGGGGGGGGLRHIFVSDFKKTPPQKKATTTNKQQKSLVDTALRQLSSLSCTSMQLCMQCAVIWHWREITSITGKNITLLWYSCLKFAVFC